MANPKSINDIVTAIEEMNHDEREDLLLRLARIDDLLEDLEDIRDLLNAAQEQSRPFEEFLADIQAERRNV